MSSDPTWTLRPEASTDAGLLLRVYAATRQNEEPMRRWPAAHRARFFALQQQAQDEDYRRRYPNAERWIIQVEGEDAGRLLLHKTPGDDRIVDIALLPRFRGNGIGSEVIRRAIAQADARGASVSLSVLADSPARRLYARLGFRECGFGVPPYVEMKRPTAPAASV